MTEDFKPKVEQTIEEFIEIWKEMDRIEPLTPLCAVNKLDGNKTN